jgi:hypothetical protein
VGWSSGCFERSHTSGLIKYSVSSVVIISAEFWVHLVCTRLSSYNSMWSCTISGSIVVIVPDALTNIAISADFDTQVRESCIV